MEFVSLMEFLKYFIMSEDFKRQVIDAVSGTAYNALTIVKFKQIMIPLPSIEVQKYLVEICKSILNKEIEMLRNAEETLAMIANLKKAILAKTFRGELGTNDKSDEKAIEILKEAVD